MHLHVRNISGCLWTNYLVKWLASLKSTDFHMDFVCALHLIEWWVWLWFGGKIFCIASHNLWQKLSSFNSGILMKMLCSIVVEPRWDWRGPWPPQIFLKILNWYILNKCYPYHLKNLKEKINFAPITVKCLYTFINIINLIL